MESIKHTMHLFKLLHIKTSIGVIRTDSVKSPIFFYPPQNTGLVTIFVWQLVFNSRVKHTVNKQFIHQLMRDKMLNTNKCFYDIEKQGS